MQHLPSTLALALAVVPIAGCATAGAGMDAQRPIGTETSISFAANGGLRNWQSGPADSGVVYVQDRQLHWYRVQMTGPCLNGIVNAQTVQYTTDSAGAFDTFSKLTFSDVPGRTCGVSRITTSLPPQGQPGAPAPSE